MAYEPKVEVSVHNQDIFGSALKTEKYEPDGLLQFRAAIDKWLEKIPPEFHANAKIKIDSVGGYEGEHHAEITVYYERPETEAERTDRKKEEAQRKVEEERRERLAFEALKRKYG